MSTDSRNEFNIVPFWENPSAQLVWREVVLAAIIGCVSVGLAYLVGPLGKKALLFSLVFAAGAVLFWTWAISREWGGKVRLDDQQFVLLTGASKSVYSWSAVTNIMLATPSQIGTLNRMAARFAGVDENRPFVEITLTRRPRVSLFRNQEGTNVVLGVPKLTKRLGLFLVDPQEFLTAAQQRRNLSSTG